MKRALLFSFLFALPMTWVASCATPGSSFSVTGAPQSAPVPGPLAPGAGVLKVSYLDVGQGDSELIETPHGQTILIDAGSAEQCQRKLEPFLEAHHVKTIDLFVITHPHTDHYGATSLFRKVAIKQAWEPGMSDVPKGFRSLLNAMPIQPWHPRAGYAATLDGADLEVVAPQDPLLSGTTSDPNNASIVFRLSYGSTRFLFPGDCELESWSRMLPNAQAKLQADVLKVSHHGSRNGTNAAVLQAIHPSHAVISCGKNNVYGHPHKETVELLQNTKVKLYRTDLSGGIQCQSDGSALSFSTGI